MRLLPFKYSLYFCRSNGLKTKWHQKYSTSGQNVYAVYTHDMFCTCISLRTHGEVETLSFLLVSSPLNNVCLAHIGVRGSWFDRLCGLAMLEGIWNIKVLHSEHVLKGLHGGIKSLPHLSHIAYNKHASIFNNIHNCNLFLRVTNKRVINKAEDNLEYPAAGHFCRSLMHH